MALSIADYELVTLQFSHKILKFKIYTQTSGDYYLITMLQCVYKCPKWPPSAWIRSPARFSAPTRLIVLIAHTRPRGGAARNAC